MQRWEYLRVWVEVIKPGMGETRQEIRAGKETDRLAHHLQDHLGKQLQRGQDGRIMLRLQTSIGEESLLDFFGDSGWELIGDSPHPWVFKRPKAPEPMTDEEIREQMRGKH